MAAPSCLSGRGTSGQRCWAGRDRIADCRIVPGSWLGFQLALKGIHGAFQGVAQHPALQIAQRVETIDGGLRRLGVELDIAPRAMPSRLAWTLSCWLCLLNLAARENWLL